MSAPIPEVNKEPMRCPTCSSRLVEVERSDVLIDACPSCRGIWLDRGELDKILVRERQIAAADPDEDFFAEVEGRKQPKREQPRHDERQSYGQRKRRKRSLLEDLFDFD